MIYGVAYAPIAHDARLRSLGFADSKKLTEDQREILFRVMKGAGDMMGFAVRVLTAAEISSGMMQADRISLNEMSFRAAINLIKRVIELGVNVHEIYVDTVGDPAKYKARLSLEFPMQTITVESKADDTYPIVSAASIAAKVVRTTRGLGTVSSRAHALPDIGDARPHLRGVAAPGSDRAQLRVWLGISVRPQHKALYGKGPGARLRLSLDRAVFVVDREEDYR